MIKGYWLTHLPTLIANLLVRMFFDLRS